MKISRREKYMLLALGILLIFISYFKYVFLPQRNRIEKLKSQELEYGKKEQYVNSLKKSIPSKQSEIKILNSRINESTTMYFPYLMQEKLIVDLDKILDKSKLEGSIMSFPEVTYKEEKKDEKKEKKKDEESNHLQDLCDEINGKVVKKKTESKGSNNSASKDNKQDKTKLFHPEIMGVEIVFKGQYVDFIEFVKNIEAYGKKTTFYSIKVSQEASGGVTGSAVVEFYAVPKIGDKLSDEDKEFMKWELNNSYGKDNPFDKSPITAAVGESIIEYIASNQNKPSYDFVMAARSINSDLPTVMLGKAKDYGKNTYIYGDNPSFENVEIQFTQKDGKYYYKYKTTRDSYPSNYNGDGEEFVTSGDSVNIKIYSNKRLGNDDLSGAKLKVCNKTDKKVLIDIEGDDAVKPRVVVSSDGENIQVNRN